MKREDVFERLEPPPGGIAKLRERTTATARPSLTVRRLVPVAAALAIAAVVFLFWSRRTTPDLLAAARRHAGLEQVALGLAPSSDRSAVLTDEERATTGLAEVPTSNATVAFYWVSSTE
jgi:hypothetical protein